MSASLFAESPRCAVTLTRNFAAPVVVRFQSSSIASRKMSAFDAATSNVSFPPLPTHLFTAFSVAWLLRKYSTGLSQVCSVMPRQRPLVLDGLSWILPHRVPPSSAAYSFPPADSIPCFHFPPFLVRSIARCDCVLEAVTS
jgi:hypothetical protein